MLSNSTKADAILATAVTRLRFFSDRMSTPAASVRKSRNESVSVGNNACDRKSERASATSTYVSLVTELPASPPQPRTGPIAFRR